MDLEMEIGLDLEMEMGLEMEMDMEIGMEMGLDFEDVVLKISEETGESRDMCELIAQKLMDIHESLKPVVSAWAHSEHIGYEFEFDGVTIDYIIAKENCTYVQAIYVMDVLLRNPDFVDKYKLNGLDNDPDSLLPVVSAWTHNEFHGFG